MRPKDTDLLLRMRDAVSAYRSGDIDLGRLGHALLMLQGLSEFEDRPWRNKFTSHAGTLDVAFATSCQGGEFDSRSSDAVAHAIEAIERLLEEKLWMTALNGLLNGYRDLLNSFWSKAVALSKDAGGDEWLDDWKQMNWEQIVEAGLASDGSVFLLPYGEGADCNGASSRVFRPDALPTHAVRCRTDGEAFNLLSEEFVPCPPEGFELDRFVTLRDGWYYEEPPFNCALILQGYQRIVVVNDDLEFELATL